MKFTANNYLNYIKDDPQRRSSLFEHASESVALLRNYPESVNLIIGANFNLLFNYMPYILNQAICQASLYDAHIFYEYHQEQHELCKIKGDFLRCSQAPISFLSQKANVEIQKIFDNLRLYRFQKHSGYIKSLVQQDNLVLLKCLEAQLHHLPNPSLESLSIVHEKTSMMHLAHRLLNVGSSKRLTSCITGLHYKTLDVYYKDVANQYKLRKDRNSQTKVLQKMKGLDFSLYIMLMLGLYTMCSRVLLNIAPTDNYYDTDHLPETISNHLAIGVYLSAQKLHEKIVEFNLRSNENFAFPHFDDFYDILSLYSQKKLHPIACASCYVPYLMVKEDYDNYKAETVQEVACPSCCKQVEYII